MAKAQSTVKYATDSMQSAIATTRAAFQTLAGAFAVHSFVSFIEGGIEAEAVLHRLNLQTGISVEMLSALRPIAKQAGTDISDTAGMVNKLEKSMLSYAQGSSPKVAAAFQQLGYSQAQVKAGLQNMDTFLPQFAKHLIETGVGGEQAGLAMILMAKGGAAALPFLAALAEKTKLVGTETDAQVEAAKQFKVSLTKLEEGSTHLAISLANSLLPSLGAITAEMLKAKEAGAGFWAMMGAGAATAMTGTDRYKNDVAMYELTGKKLLLEKQIADVEDVTKAYHGVSAAKLKEQLASVEAELVTTRAYRVELEKIEAAQTKKETPHTGLTAPPGKPGAGAGGMTWEEMMVKASTLRLKRNEEAEAAADKAADADKQRAKALDDQQNREAEGWMRIADPTRLYYQQLDQIGELIASGKLGVTDAEKARVKVYEDIGKALEKSDSLGKQADAAAKLAEHAWTSASNQMGDALANFVMTGKLDFARLTQSILSDILRMQIRAQTSGLFGNLFGGGTSSNLPSAMTAPGLYFPEYASGTDYVPQTGLALVHQGEKITPAGENGGMPTLVFNIANNTGGPVSMKQNGPAVQTSGQIIFGLWLDTVQNNATARSAVAGLL
jgi:hypothetical protein